MLILKIMSARRIENDYPESAHILVSNVREVLFTQASPDKGDSQAWAVVWIDGKPDAVHIEVTSSAFVMNAQGRTVSRFEKQFWPESRMDSEDKKWSGRDEEMADRAAARAANRYQDGKPICGREWACLEEVER